MDAATQEMLDALTFLKEKVEQLPARDDVRAIVDAKIKPLAAAVDRRFDGIEERLADIAAGVEEGAAHLAAVEQTTASHAGYAKKIDHILERVAAIERHLGIDKQIAA